MKRIAIFLVLGICVGPSVRADEPAVREMHVTDAVGQVTLKTDANSKRALVVDEETPLQVGDLIETGPMSSAEVTLDGVSVLALRANTQLKITKLYLKNTQLELTQGSFLAKVKPVTSVDQNIIIKLPTAVVAIRGTEFGAETGPGLAHVGVFDEGHVVVAGAWGHEHVILGPNQETKVPLSSVPHVPYRLRHFQVYKRQLPALRGRVTYWGKNWKPLTMDRRQAIRQHLSDPTRKPLPHFRRPAPPKPPLKKRAKARKDGKRQTKNKKAR